jgi:hypothetical protein
LNKATTWPAIARLIGRTARVASDGEGTRPAADGYAISGLQTGLVKQEWRRLSCDGCAPGV